MISPENAIYQTVKNAVEAAAFDSILVGTQVQATVYQAKTDKTICVGNCESNFVPVGESIKETDADIVLQILAAVADEEDGETYPAARDTARAMTIAVVKILNGDPSLGGNICDLEIRRAYRGWAKVQSKVYAVSLLPIRTNFTNSE